MSNAVAIGILMYVHDDHLVSFTHLYSQEACVQGNLIAICLEQLTDPYPPLRQWLAICLGRVWFNYEAARWCAVRDSAPDKLYCLLSDPLPEVRDMIKCCPLPSLLEESMDIIFRELYNAYMC